MAKITGQNLDTMRDAIAPLDTADTRAAYLRGEFHNADRVKDLDRRYRWDLLWSSGLSGWLVATVYDDLGANDTHVDTALRSIVPPLQ